MQDIEEKVMMLKDAVLQPDCNLYYDYQGPHNRNFFGKLLILTLFYFDAFASYICFVGLH